MAQRIHFLSLAAIPKIPKFRTHPIPSLLLFTNKPKPPRISCTNNTSDADLASDLAIEVAKISTHIVQREEAMKKSKEMLFTELCQFMDFREEEVKKKWKNMSEEERWVLVKGFVSEWSANFHPLSARSVKEMVDEYLHEENFEKDSKFSSSEIFPGLKKMMGFSPKK